MKNYNNDHFSVCVCGQDSQQEAAWHQRWPEDRSGEDQQGKAAQSIEK